MSDTDYTPQHAASPVYPILTDLVNLGEKYTEFPTVDVPTAPTVGVDAAGVPVVTIPLTTKAKAYAALIGSTVTTAATGILAIVGPDSVEAHILVAVIGVVGVVGTVLGVHQTTNLPDMRAVAKHGSTEA